MDCEESGTNKLTKLYETYKNRMYITACRVLNDPFLSEDAVHETFVSLSRNLDKIGDVGSIKTASYVIKATRNTALNFLRKKQTELPVLISEREMKGDEAALDSICSAENYNYIVNAILSLEEKYRDVLSLYYLNDLSVKEIASALSRKETTVKQQLARGRRKLTALINEEVNINEK